MRSQMTRKFAEDVAKMLSAVGWKSTVSIRRGCDAKTSSGSLKPLDVRPEAGIRQILIWNDRLNLFSRWSINLLQ